MRNVFRSGKKRVRKCDELWELNSGEYGVAKKKEREEDKEIVRY